MLTTLFNKFITYIGVELHIQLNRSPRKLFTRGLTGASTKVSNSLTDWYSLGIEGVLPVINSRVALKAALLKNLIKYESRTRGFVFDRKNYMYRDLPKGYQITQDTSKFCNYFKFYFFSYFSKKIEFFYIKGMQLEEDVASLNKNTGLYDYNRSGYPLIELVTDKLSIKGVDVLLSFIEAIKLLFIKLNMSSCAMHKGELRCDLNLSTYSLEEEIYLSRVEVKNLNSNASIKGSFIFEKYRQFIFFTKNIGFKKKLKGLKNITKGWALRTSKTVFLRYKEPVEVYNFFIDPDIPNLFIKTVWGGWAKHSSIYQRFNFTKTRLNSLFFVKKLSGIFIENAESVFNRANLYYFNPYGYIKLQPFVINPFLKRLKSVYCVDVIYKLVGMHCRLTDLTNNKYFKDTVLVSLQSENFSAQQASLFFKYKLYRGRSYLFSNIMIYGVTYLLKKHAFLINKYARGFPGVIGLLVGPLLKTFEFKNLKSIKISFYLKNLMDRLSFLLCLKNI